MTLTDKEKIEKVLDHINFISALMEKARDLGHGSTGWTEDDILDIKSILETGKFPESSTYDDSGEWRSHL